jgi:hypothetical protein
VEGGDPPGLDWGRLRQVRSHAGNRAALAKGDPVVLGFIHGDPERPFVLGSLPGPEDPDADRRPTDPDRSLPRNLDAYGLVHAHGSSHLSMSADAMGAGSRFLEQSGASLSVQCAERWDRFQESRTLQAGSCRILAADRWEGRAGESWKLASPGIGLELGPGKLLAGAGAAWVLAVGATVADGAVPGPVDLGPPSGGDGGAASGAAAPSPVPAPVPTPRTSLQLAAEGLEVVAPSTTLAFRKHCAVQVADGLGALSGRFEAQAATITLASHAGSTLGMAPGMFLLGNLDRAYLGLACSDAFRALNLVAAPPGTFASYWEVALLRGQTVAVKAMAKVGLGSCRILQTAQALRIL